MSKKVNGRTFAVRTRAIVPAGSNQPGSSRVGRAVELTQSAILHLDAGDRSSASALPAARQLGLCTAAIYGLCVEGALPHIRILNTIRIAPADLAAFIVARRVWTKPRE